MRRSKHYFILGILICSIVILIGCEGYKGRAFERKPDGSIGPTIAGVEITFVSEDGSSTHTVTTNNAGHYKINLIPQRYVVTATHPDYHDYSSAPGFSVVTGEGYQTSQYMKMIGAPFIRCTDEVQTIDFQLEREPTL